MNEKVKLTLSSKELELVCNKEWILTKHVIIEKVYQLFGSLALSMQQYLAQRAGALPTEAVVSSPKISRGENYRGLPYVMLDYPRHFMKGSTLAIRTLFWWGNSFSIHLHLSGICKEKAIPVLMENFKSLQENAYWVCIHADPWEHHFEEDNYVPLQNYTSAEFSHILHSEYFLKIAKQISLEQWDVAEEFIESHFKQMTKLLRINFPGGERGPLPGIPITGFDL